MRRYLDNYCYYFSTNILLITGSISFYLQRALQQKFVMGRYEKDKFGFKTLHFGCLMTPSASDDTQYPMVLQCLNFNRVVYMKSKVIYPITVFSERRNDLVYP